MWTSFVQKGQEMEVDLPVHIGETKHLWWCMSSIIYHSSNSDIYESKDSLGWCVRNDGGQTFTYRNSTCQAGSIAARGNWLNCPFGMEQLHKGKRGYDSCSRAVPNFIIIYRLLHFLWLYKRSHPNHEAKGIFLQNIICLFEENETSVFPALQSCKVYRQKTFLINCYIIWNLSLEETPIFF